MKKIIVLLFAALFLIAPIFLTQSVVFAGQIGCQTGSPQNPARSKSGGSSEIRKFAAAQTRYERNQPPGAGNLRGNDSDVRSNVSFFAALTILFGGVWALLALLLNRFGERFAPRGGRLAPFRRFAFQPSIALTVFGSLFVAAIAGGILIAPSKTAAGKPDKPNKAKMTGAMNPSSKPVFKAAQTIGGSGYTQIGAPVFDAAGNRYVRGGFTNNLTIGETTLAATRDFDAFLAKYDQNGDVVWARQGSGMTTGAQNIPIEGATALAVDASGNVYVGGSFVKTLTLQGGANPNITLTDDGAAGYNYESFVAKYDANGNLLWARGGNTGSPKHAADLETGQNGIDQIVFDSSGNPYVTGFVSGTRFFGSSVANNGQSDIVLAKLNPATGAVVWKQIIGGTDDDNGLDLKIDQANNLYLVGNFGSPSITFPNGDVFSNPDDPNDPLENSTNTFVAKFDSGGANSWVKVLDNADVVGISQIAVSAAGEIYLTGYFLDSVTFPTQPTPTTLIETEGNGDDEESEGGYLAKMDTNGAFLWAKEFGGVGDALALDAAGRIYIVGVFFDGGTFGADTANVEFLASFGGEDLFVARYDANGGFDWAKAIAGNSQEGAIAVGNPSGGGTENNYNPLGIAYNAASGTMFVSGDFGAALSLDCITLTASGAKQSYVAELSADNEVTSCRIWNGLDADDNNWDSPDNWNGGVLPRDGDSVYVPYTGNNFDAPTFNPATNTAVGKLSVADDRVLTLQKDLNIAERLDLFGGIVDAGNNKVSLSPFSAQPLSTNDGRVIGKLEKVFFGGVGTFTFPVGTANGYSPVTISSNIFFGESSRTFAVTANQGAYPNQATGLPQNRAARWWNLTNGGLTNVDLTFKYLPGDITAGTENQYRAYRIPTGGGAASQVNSTINTTAKTVFVPNVSQFSDWTLAQQPLAPTAAMVTVGGRVVAANGRAVAGALVSLVDGSGQTRTARTNSFGAFSFADVPSGGTYVATASAKRWQFAAQVVSPLENVTDLIFTATE